MKQEIRKKKKEKGKKEKIRNQNTSTILLLSEIQQNQQFPKSYNQEKHGKKTIIKGKHKNKFNKV